MEAGEFVLRTESTPINPPRPDYQGRLRMANEEHFLEDPRFPPKHERHIVLRAHCFRLIDGSIGASGKVDPKEMLIGDIQYRQLEFVNPTCALCNSGDMIPYSERFFSSKYKPDTP
jgi:hypothetical protein